MRVADFIEVFRTAAFDVQEPHFWSDTQIVLYLNEAVQEACERAKLIEDRTASITTVPGQGAYPLPSSAFEVKRLTYRGRPLEETSVEALDCDMPGWESRAGQPRCFVFEPESGARPAAVRLVPTPVTAEVMGLTVYRGALKPLDAEIDTAKPEIPERFHMRLLDWMYYRAYSVPDADIFDPAKSAQALAQFEQAFGARPDANVQRKQRDRQPPVVRCAW